MYKYKIEYIHIKKRKEKMTMKLSKVFGGLVLVASTCLLTACGSNDKKDTSVSDIKDKGTMVVALNPEFAPFEFKTLVDGKDTIVGADVKIAEAIGEELGVKVKFSSMSFNNVLASLQSGKADIAISGISATPERKKAYNFSEPYYESENVVLIKKTDLDKYTKTTSLDGLSVGTQKGTIQETVASEQLKGAKVVALTQNGEMINELKNGQIQAVVLEKPIAEGYVANNDDLTISNITLKNDDADAYAVALPKDDDKLTKKVNKVINDLKDSGKIDQFVQDAYALSTSDSNN
ncbi:ABC transporter, substrate-binding protein, family 3 [Streptococcus equinus ATCC 9812]|uniref:ABC transporter, substrate-binding protein, family 3 n=2 Tax=Streptococcus equinus TaxID=1335 RepID=E8JP26_STREI|nr:ABC transporter, substrate-binding protein, family 3 [Streptococcus equinus ATCC 9812]